MDIDRAVCLLAGTLTLLGASRGSRPRHLVAQARRPPLGPIRATGPRVAYGSTVDEYASERCRNPSRWPRPRRRAGFCDTCLNGFAAAQTATMLRPGDGARARFRVRHEPCGAMTDVSLPMLRKGWVCRACKLGSLTASG